MAGHSVKAWVPGTSIRVGAGNAVAAVPGIARAAVQAWPVVVAGSDGVTVVLADIVAWEDLGAGAASEGVAKAAGTVVRVGARIAASACRLRSARVSCAVVDVGAGLAVTVPAGGAGITGEASIRRSHIMTCHVDVSEARTVGASVGIIAGRAVAAVARVAGAGVLAWPVVVAGSVGVTVVLASIVAWEDLGAGAASEGVAKAAGTVVRVGARIATGAHAISAWSPSAVVDVVAGDAIAIETGRTRVTGETLCRCRLVMAGHSVKAWVPVTSIRVGAGHAVAAVARVAGAAV
jgi:hypothetical protein